jgi:DNA end-binding protein Ku
MNRTRSASTNCTRTAINGSSSNWSARSTAKSKGYEVERDKFVVMDSADLDAVKLETTHTIELVQFIRPKELDPIYLDTPYFVGPDGPVSIEAYAVLREALRKANYLALGQVVLSGREKLVTLKPVDKGLLMTTLRYPAEIRQAASYLDDLAHVKVDDAQIGLARQLIENKAVEFNPAAFTDRYQAALLDAIKAKLNGAPPVKVKPAAVGQATGLPAVARRAKEGVRCQVLTGDWRNVQWL